MASVLLGIAVTCAAAGCGSATHHAAKRRRPTAPPRTGFAARPAAQILSATAATLSRTNAFEISGRTALSETLVTIALAVQQSDRLAENIVNGVQNVQVRVIGETGFIRGSLDFWVAHSFGGPYAAAQRRSGHWLASSAAAVAKLAENPTSLSGGELATCLRRTFVRPVVLGLETVAGQATVVLRSAGGVPGSSPADLFVSTTAPHLPVAFQQTGAQRSGGSALCDHTPLSGGGEALLRFTHWNDVRVSVPAEAKPLS